MGRSGPQETNPRVQSQGCQPGAILNERKWIGRKCPALGYGVLVPHCNQVPGSLCSCFIDVRFQILRPGPSAEFFRCRWVANPKKCALTRISASDSISSPGGRWQWQFRIHSSNSSHVPSIPARFCSRASVEPCRFPAAARPSHACVCPSGEPPVHGLPH